MSQPFKEHLEFYGPFAAVIFVYILGLPVPVMEVDAAQYAMISWEMLQRGDFLQVTDMGNDYLDKPPLLFWLSAISYKIFGIGTASYKLPSLLFTILAMISTYKLSAMFYNDKTARLAALILGSTQALFLINNDIRTDTILLGAVVFAIWQIIAFTREGKWYQLVLGFVGVGLAMLAKGPIGLVTPVMALGAHFLYKREFRNFFRWQWLPGLVIVGLMLLPMCIGLYQQFDLHPEKVINGEKGVSGLEFYFWTQSFGRITGQNRWSNDASFFYFFHNVAWAFLPWTIFLVGGLIRKIYQMVESKIDKDAVPELFSLGGFVLPFLALSLSAFKLPHYIFIIFPMGAVLAADFLYSLSESTLFKGLRWFQFVVNCLIWIILGALTLWAFWPDHWMFYCFYFIGLGMFLIASLYPSVFIKPAWAKMQLIVLPALISILAVNFFMNASIYPQIMQYQAQSNIAYAVNDQRIDKDKLYKFGVWGRSFDFYVRKIIPLTNTDHMQKTVKKEDMFVYTDKKNLEIIHKMNLNTEILFETPKFNITRLTFQFAMPHTRESVLGRHYLVRVSSIE